MRTPEEQREMLRLRALGWGSKRISTATGIPRGTVQSFLKREAKRPLSAPPPVKNNGQKISPPSTPLNWESRIDQMGQAILGLVGRALERGDESRAMQWMDRFIRAFQAKVGAVRIGQLNVNSEVTNISINEIQIFINELIDYLDEVIPPEIYTDEVKAKIIDIGNRAGSQKGNDKHE